MAVKGKGGGQLIWPTPGEIPQLDLNIDAMRRKVEREMAEAIKPFQKRLAELDVVEQVLNRETHIIAKEAKKAARAQRNGNGNGFHRAVAGLLEPVKGPYTNMRQPAAISAMLEQSPGLEARTITEQLVSGGFRFVGKGDPSQSIATCLRVMTHKKLLKCLKSVPGTGIFNRYFLPSQEMPAPGASVRDVTNFVASEDLSQMGTTEAMVEVMSSGPVSGMLVADIVQGMLARGFKFSRHKTPPSTRLLWTLKGIVNRGHAVKIGSGSESMYKLRKPQIHVRPSRHK